MRSHAWAACQDPRLTAALRIVPMVRRWISASALRTLSANSAYRSVLGRSLSRSSPRAIHSQNVAGRIPWDCAATSRGAPVLTASTILSATSFVSLVFLGMGSLYASPEEGDPPQAVQVRLHAGGQEPRPPPLPVGPYDQRRAEEVQGDLRGSLEAGGDPR